MLLLDERTNTDGEVGCFFHIAYSESEPRLMHTHEFFELVLTDDAPFLHRINGDTVTLLPHSLLFIRPHDVHTFAPIDEKTPFSFSNLAFSRKTAEALFGFFGMGYPSDALCDAKMPPAVLLDEARYTRLRNDLMRLNTVPLAEQGKRQYMLRELLYRLMRSFYESDTAEGERDIPDWLLSFCRAVGEPKSFSLSRAELVRLSGKSYEYLARSFRRYLGMTIGEYVWEARLTYAANLLIHTYRSVTDICFEAGFVNVSWFYAQFEKRFGTTPRSFRRAYRRDETV